MHISKDPDERRQELVSFAKEPFSKKDFNDVKVSDIVMKASVARGTYYKKDIDDIKRNNLRKNSWTFINSSICLVGLISLK